MFSEEFIKIFWDKKGQSEWLKITPQITHKRTHLKRRLFCPEAHTLDFQPRRIAEEKKSRAIHKVERAL